MNQGTTDRILFALYRLSRDTRRIDASTLGQASGATATIAAEALLALERRGLVDASRARLTLLGLAHASRLAAATGGGGVSAEARQAKPNRAHSVVPLAANGNTERPSKGSEGEEPVDENGEPVSNPLELPLYQPLYRPLREPLHNGQPASDARH